MPTYEYTCDTCGRPAQLFLSFAEYDRGRPSCPHCGAGTLRRRVGRVRIVRSAAARDQSLSDDPGLDRLDQDDPRALGGFMRRMAEETGEGLDGELGEIVGRLEHGESPAEIERSMPDLGPADD